MASRLFTQQFIRAQIKENIKVSRHWPLCGNSPGTSEFPAQMASNAENVSIWWRHHVNWSMWRPFEEREELKKLWHVHHFLFCSIKQHAVVEGRRPKTFVKINLHECYSFSSLISQPTSVFVVCYNPKKRVAGILNDQNRLLLAFRIDAEPRIWFNKCSILKRWIGINTQETCELLIKMLTCLRIHI